MSTDSDFSNFYSWIQENGGQIHEHIKIDIKEERGLHTTDSIESYNALSIIPRTLLINHQHADLSAMNIGVERQRLIIFLLREYMKYDASFWFPWIKLLNIDKEKNELLTNKIHLFDCVQYSTLGQALKDRYQKLQEEYEQLTASNMVETSFEIFCTIDHLVLSRVIELPENESLSLIPFIDLANHSLDANARWFIDDATHNIVLRSERTLNPDEEITINYGLKSNEELLYSYDFTLLVNPNDCVTLPVSLLSDDILLQDKFQLIQELELPPRLTVDINGHLNDESHRLVQILSAQTRATIDRENKHYKSYLYNLYNECLHKLNMCSDEKQFIKYYLDSQKLIIRKAIDNLK